MSEPRDRAVDLGGRRLHLLEWAPARPQETLLCIHGGCANAHWWYHSGAILGARHRVLALDLSGHGESDPLADGDYSLEGHADDVAAVIQHLGLQSVVVAGHSFGGFVALAAIPKVIDVLRALILVDSRGHVRKRSARYLSALSKFPNPIYATREEAVAGFQLLPRVHAADPEVVAHVAANAIRPTESGEWTLAFDRRALRAAAERAFTDELRQLDRPTLVVRGEHSTALTEHGQASLVEEIADAEGATIAGAHHHLMLDRPAEFAAAVERFLARLA